MTLTEEQRRDEKRAKRIETAPVSCRKILSRSFLRKTAPRQAIKAMCLECVGFERKAVTECTAYACPLWESRPYQEKPETV